MTPKKPRYKKKSKKAVHLATLRALEHDKLAAAKAETKMIEALIQKVGEHEQRITGLEQLGGAKGERGERGFQGEKGEKGGGFWG
jgi:hypothetical protein